MLKQTLNLTALLALLIAGPVIASDELDYYEVTVINLTRGQSFTPILIATHRPGTRLFEVGAPAGAELATLAEGGDTAPLAAQLAANPQVLDVVTVGSLLAPGASTTARIRTQRGFDQLSAAAMLIPTNDGFIAVNGASGPRGRETLVLRSPAYDAGSEPNSELCAEIPGRVCGGQGISPGLGGEGYVHIHAGIHGIGNLAPADYDWRNPVAEIRIRRAR